MSTTNHRTMRLDFLDTDTLHPHSDARIRNKQGGGIYLVIGASGSGKTVIIKSLMRAKSYMIPLALVISESEMANAQFAPHLPAALIYDKYDKEIIESVLVRQALAANNLQNPWCTLVLDDCMNKTSNMTDIMNMFKMGRQFKLFILVAMQYLFDIGPALREQAAGIFLLPAKKLEVRRKLYTSYATIIPSFEMFERLMSMVERQRGALFIDYRTPTTDWRRNVYWYRACDDIVDGKSTWSAVCKDVEHTCKLNTNPNYNKHRLNASFEAILRKKFKK